MNSSKIITQSWWNCPFANQRGGIVNRQCNKFCPWFAKWLVVCCHWSIVTAPYFMLITGKNKLELERNSEWNVHVVSYMATSMPWIFKIEWGQEHSASADLRPDSSLHSPCLQSQFEEFGDTPWPPNINRQSSYSKQSERANLHQGWIVITCSFYPSIKFHCNPFISFWVLLLTDKQTNATKNIISLSEITRVSVISVEMIGDAPPQNVTRRQCVHCVQKYPKNGTLGYTEMKWFRCWTLILYRNWLCDMCILNIPGWYMQLSVKECVMIDHVKHSTEI